MTWILYDEAADIADELLDLVGLVEKAARKPPSPLSRKGFDAAISRLARDAVKAVSPFDRAALARAGANIATDWTRASQEDIDRAAGRIGAAQVAIVESALPVVRSAIARGVEGVIGQTKAAVKDTFGLEIRPSLDVGDSRQVWFASESQTGFVRDEYGRRSVRFSELSRQIVAMGLRDGLDSTDIAEELKAELDAYGFDRSAWYWRVAASVQVARARSYGQLRGFDEAGIELVRFTAVKDERTTEQCLFLDGTVFSVANTLSRYQDAALSDEPESVVIDRLPFLRSGKDEDGREMLYINRGDDRERVAYVDRAGAGARDSRGEYSQAWTSKQLEDAGCCTPPLHELCRSTLLPA